MKKPPANKPMLSKTQEYAIKGMLADNKSVSEIAQFLKKARAIIQLYIDENLSEESAPTKTPVASDFMINKSVNDKRGVAIMTAAASERGDISRKKVTGNTTTRHTRNAIFKIKKDK